jgi:sugar phosphate isomerase/epimerase
MKLGISSYSFTWAVGVPGSPPEKRLNETDLLGIAKEMNLSLVQIADNMPLDSIPADRFENLFQKAAENNIQLEVGAKNMTPDNLERYLLIAEKIKSKILRFVIDDDDFRPELTEIISIILNAEPEFRKRGVILALENHERLLTGEFVHIMEKVNSPYIGICLDCANSLGLGQGFREVVEQLAPFAVNFHLKEVFIKRKYHKMGFDIEGRPFGEGCLPLKWILEQLPSKCQTAILEQWTPPEETLQATIIKEREWAGKSISYLKNFFDII